MNLPGVPGLVTRPVFPQQPFVSDEDSVDADGFADQEQTADRELLHPRVAQVFGYLALAHAGDLFERRIAQSDLADACAQLLDQRIVVAEIADELPDGRAADLHCDGCRQRRFPRGRAAAYLRAPRSRCNGARAARTTSP
jgi:hypothetical protein